MQEYQIPHRPVPIVDIKELVGLRTLHGIWRGVVKLKDKYESAQCALVQIDDQVYEICEDPEDGYRSCMGWCVAVNHADALRRVVPIDPPMVCEWRHIDRGYHYDGRSDILYALNEQTGLVVLELGTQNIDDYYPSFVFSWTPEGYMPEWLKPRDTGIVIEDEGKKWLVIDDFATHAEAKTKAETHYRSGVFRQTKSDIRVRVNAITKRFEVQERVC